MMYNFNNLEVSVKDHTAIVVVDREAKLNALNQETMEELGKVLDQLEKDPHVRGIVLTGRGEKAFVAGADIQEFVDQTVEQATAISAKGHVLVMDRLENFSKPVVAAINGFALGGGLELAMSCHMRVAAEDAKMGLPEVSLGLIPGYGGTQRLPQLVGKGKAFEMIMTGDMIDAKDALQWGLVNHVVAKEELMERCLSLLGKIYTRSPQAIAKAIQVVNAGCIDSKEGFRQEIAQFGESFGTTDGKEGVKAFLERRKPNF